MGKTFRLFTTMLVVLCMLLCTVGMTANADELTGDNENYSNSSEEPSSGSEEPSSGNEEPSSSSEEPSSGNEEPSSGSEEPSSGNEEPSSGNEEPSSGSEEPSSGNEEPSSGNEEPSSGNEEPSSGNTDPVFAMGDLNADGSVTAGEARSVLRAAVGLDTIDAAVIAYADVDHNGVLTANDARDTLRVAAGLDEKETHSFKNDAVTVSTCTVAGNVQYACTCCELTGEIALPLEAHDFEVVDHLDPACETKGYDKFVCSVCKAEKETAIAALAHKYAETERTEATCTATGLVKSTCSVCGDVKEETLKTKGHSYQETKNEPDTCTAAGVKEYTCSVCSYVLSLPGKALGHEMVRCTETVPQHCSRCNEKYTGVQQAATGLYYYYTKSGNSYTCAKNKIVGSSYYGPDGARVDDAAIEAAVEFVNTYTDSSDSAYNRLSDCYYILVDYFGYKNNPDVTTMPDGRHIPGYCTQMLDEWSGNCYRFAAAFAYMARVLGYDAGFITGQISASGGGTTTHGLTEIYYNGTTYWCDAMMQNKYPSTNSFFVTSSTYPYGYTRNYRIRMYVSDGKVTWS